MYSFYVRKGHSLRDLQDLTVEEELFYMVSMELYYERLATLLNADKVDNSPENIQSEVKKLNGSK